MIFILYWIEKAIILEKLDYFIDEYYILTIHKVSNKITGIIYFGVFMITGIYYQEGFCYN